MTSFLVPYLVTVLSYLSMNNVPKKEFELPATWTKDFKITYSFSGSMDGSRTELTFTYDSCNYTNKPGMKAPETIVFAMTEAYRAEILKKMHELKVHTIKSHLRTARVYDGWSTSLSFGDHWIRGGTSAKMNDKHEEIFSAACRYLQDFAAMKGKK